MLLVSIHCFGAASSSSSSSQAPKKGAEEKGVKGVKKRTPVTLLAMAQGASPPPAEVRSSFDEWQREKLDDWLKQLLSF